MTEQAQQLPTRDVEETNRTELQRLRQDYPDWGFLIVGDRWTAVRGRNTLLQAPTPQELRGALPPLPGEDQTAADAQPHAQPDTAPSRPPADERLQAGVT